MTRARGIDWDSQPLGIVPDCALARILGVARGSVVDARRCRKIPPAPSGYIDWDAQPLGAFPDSVIARQLGVGPPNVTQARRVRHVPMCRPAATVLPGRVVMHRRVEKLCPCGRLFMGIAVANCCSIECTGRWAFHSQSGPILGPIGMAIARLKYDIKRAESAGIHSPTVEGVSSENQ